MTIKIFEDKTSIHLGIAFVTEVFLVLSLLLHFLFLYLCQTVKKNHHGMPRNLWQEGLGTQLIHRLDLTKMTV